MDKEKLFSRIDERAEELKGICRQIWEYAETALNEERSSALLKDYLEQAGFRIKEVPGLPTAFIAECGEGMRSGRAVRRCRAHMPVCGGIL